MTLADKVGQMTQAERAAVGNDTPMITTRLGSLLSGGGSVPTPNTPASWADMVDNFQPHALATPLQIPLIYGIDAVHGHGNLYGATVFPHNVGLGATRDPALVERVGEVTAEETRATGIPWTFAPCVCVSRDERWGRATRLRRGPGAGDQLATTIDGLQGHGPATSPTRRVLATAKHFLGDGETRYGTPPALPDRPGCHREQPERLRADPPGPVQDRGARGPVGTVMPSFSSLDSTGTPRPPVKMHANRDQITGVLKRSWASRLRGQRLGGHPPDRPATTPQQVKIGVNAGIDMFMVPFSIQAFVTRCWPGRHRPGRCPDRRRGQADPHAEVPARPVRAPVHRPRRARRDRRRAHRPVARQAAAESQVLLKNAAACCRCPTTQRSTSPGPTPTTWATSTAAGR